MKYISQATLLWTLAMLQILAGCKSEIINAYDKHKDTEKYPPGYVLDLDGKKTEGLIRFDGYLPPKQVVIFISEKGEQKLLTCGGLKGYGFGKRDFISDGYMFYEVLRNDKKAGLYRITEVKTKGNPGYYNGSGYTAPFAPIPKSEREYYDVFYVKKVNETSFKKVRKYRFKGRFSKYFSDCPLVKEKIKKKEFKVKDIDEIIFAYSSNACD